VWCTVIREANRHTDRHADTQIHRQMNTSADTHTQTDMTERIIVPNTQIVTMWPMSYLG